MSPTRPYVDAIAAAPPRDDVRAAEALLRDARQPLVLVGGSRWNDDGARCAAPIRRGGQLPVACAFRHQDLFDNRHPNYAGDVGIGINPKLAARVRDADVLLVIGERLGEMTTSGYTLLDVPMPAANADPRPSGCRRARQRLPAGARDRRDARRLPRCDRRALPRGRTHVAGLAARAHDEYEAWRAPRAVPGAVDLWQIVRWLDERLPDDAILTNGAGNYATWVHRLFRYGGKRQAARALLRLDGLRRAVGGRGEARASASASSSHGTATAAS